MALSDIKACCENLENIVLSERSQTQKVVEEMSLFIQNIQNRQIPWKQNPVWWFPGTGVGGSSCNFLMSAGSPFGVVKCSGTRKR